MPEKLQYEPGDLPEMKLHMANGEFVATPVNTTLFTFLGRLAMYDHVFLQTGEETEATIVGTYVFNQHPVFREMAEFIMEQNYPMVLNRIEVPDCDVAAFNRMVEQSTGDLDGGVPEGWS